MVAPSNVSARPSQDAADSAILALEEFLPYRLNVLATEVSQTLARVYGEKFGISIPEWRALATLGQFGSITARDIGQHSRMHKTTVSRAIAALEKRQLVIRTTNSADMREAHLTMSEAGRSIYAEIVPMARAFSQSLCTGMTDADQRLFAAMLDRLLSRVSAMEASPDLSQNPV